MAKNHNQIQHEILVAKGKVFLDVLRETANISQACKVADVTRGVIYRERERGIRSSQWIGRLRSRRRAINCSGRCGGVESKGSKSPCIRGGGR